MKSLRNIILICILGFNLIGCDTLNSTSQSSNETVVDPVVAYLPLIQAGSQIATGSLLQFSIKDEQKRILLANQIYASAKALDALTTGKCPSVEEVTAVLNAYNVDPSITEYATYVSSISSLYAKYYTLYVQGNGLYAAEVLNALAKGAYDGALIYKTNTNI